MTPAREIPAARRPLAPRRESPLPFRGFGARPAGGGGQRDAQPSPHRTARPSLPHRGTARLGSALRGRCGPAGSLQPPAPATAVGGAESERRFRAGDSRPGADAHPKAAPRPRVGGRGEKEEEEEEEDAAGGRGGRGGRRGGEARPEGRAQGSPADRDQVPPLHRGVAGRDALPAGGGAEPPQAEGRHLEWGQPEPPRPARSLCSRPPGLGDAALAAARGGRGGPRAAPAPPAGRSAREQRPEAGGRPGEEAPGSPRRGRLSPPPLPAAGQPQRSQPQRRRAPAPPANGRAGRARRGAASGRCFKGARAANGSGRSRARRASCRHLGRGAAGGLRAAFRLFFCVFSPLCLSPGTCP